MLKFNFLGDPHAKVSNLEEMDKLVDFVCSLENASEVDFLLIAGDLFNDHSVVRLEVAAFWVKALQKLLQRYRKILVLVGNHDLAGSKQMEKQLSAIHLITSNDSSVILVDKPMIYKDLALIPYTSSAEEFYAEANKLFDLGAKEAVICHQTFNGAKYDNGFYAPNGFETEKVPQTHVISGHIHTEQKFDKVFYPGTAKWETRSDANQDKGVWEIALNGKAMESRKFKTDKVLVPIKELIIEEGKPTPEFPENAKVYVELIGSSAWIKKEKEKYKSIASIKSTYKDNKEATTRKASGLSIEEYLKDFFEPKSVKREDILNTLKKDYELSK